jgi:hypothetical protein
MAPPAAFLEAGTLDLAKVGAAGTNFVLFKGPATLKIVEFS